MESTVSDNGKATRMDPDMNETEFGETTRQWRSATGQEVSNLMADVQDLLGRLAHVADPDVIRVRAKVASALSTAKATIARGSERVQRQAKDAINAGDSYVHDQPWQAIGIAAAAGLVVGFLISRR